MLLGIKAGTKVSSEYGEGVVIAGTDQWCIYKRAEDGKEVALPWSQVYIRVTDVGEEKKGE